MPSTSKAQARLMAACAHGADYPSCPQRKVAKEFNQADKGSKRLSEAMKERPQGKSGDQAEIYQHLKAQGRAQ